MNDIILRNIGAQIMDRPNASEDLAITYTKWFREQVIKGQAIMQPEQKASGGEAPATEEASAEAA